MPRATGATLEGAALSWRSYPMSRRTAPPFAYRRDWLPRAGSSRKHWRWSSARHPFVEVGTPERSAKMSRMLGRFLVPHLTATTPHPPVVRKIESLLRFARFLFGEEVFYLPFSNDRKFRENDGRVGDEFTSCFWIVSVGKLFRHVICVVHVKRRMPQRTTIFICLLELRFPEFLSHALDFFARHATPPFPP